MAKIKLLHNSLLEQWQLVLPLLVLTVFILKRSTKGSTFKDIEPKTYDRR